MVTATPASSQVGATPHAYHHTHPFSDEKSKKDAFPMECFMLHMSILTTQHAWEDLLMRYHSSSHSQAKV
jgi:hypothetical protein